MNQPTTTRPEEVTINTTHIDHPSTWVPVRCANEADASLRNGWLPDGAGAQYLLAVVSSLLEAIAYEPDADRADQAHYAADSNISVYTHEQWETFHDLQAWSQDTYEVHDLVGLPPKFHGGSDWITRTAVAAIYLIGSRLAHSVVHYLDALDNEEDE